MNKQKFTEIEKMADVIQSYCDYCPVKDKEQETCLLCKMEHLYNHDYRKQEQGEWIYHEAVITDEGFISGYSCSLCNAFVYEEDFHQDTFHKKFCGNCGAQMKGVE